MRDTGRKEMQSKCAPKREWARRPTDGTLLQTRFARFVICEALGKAMSAMANDQRLSQSAHFFFVANTA